MTKINYLVRTLDWWVAMPISNQSLPISQVFFFPNSEESFVIFHLLLRTVVKFRSQLSHCRYQTLVIIDIIFQGLVRATVAKGVLHLQSQIGNDCGSMVWGGSWIILNFHALETSPKIHKYIYFIQSRWKCFCLFSCVFSPGKISVSLLKIMCAQHSMIIILWKLILTAGTITLQIQQL